MAAPGSEEEFTIEDVSDESSDSDYSPPQKRCKAACCNDRAGVECGVSESKSQENEKSNSKSKYVNFTLELFEDKKKGKKQVKRNQKFNRNRTYAEKKQCVDLDVVDDFLSTKRCTCKKNCIGKLCEMRDKGALEMVYDIRHDRFEGQPESKTSHSEINPPRG